MKTSAVFSGALGAGTLAMALNALSPAAGVVYAQDAVPTVLTISSPAWRFSFGKAKPAAGIVPVTPESSFSQTSGFGFEAGARLTGTASAITSEKPFIFSAAVPEGNYRITVTLGDKTAASNITVKAEARRLMVEAVPVAAGKQETRTFIVNVSTPRIPGGGTVSLRTRPGQPQSLTWDEKLSLEFNGTHPAVSAIQIDKVENFPTIFIAGDSTVTDQGREPWAAWGQMFPRFLKPQVAVANYAESGLTLGTFRGQKRLAKILATAKPGDFVLIQFGHNDQKDKGEDAGPFKSYKTNLKEYVSKIRATGATPVLVTSMERRRWSPDGKPQSTLSDYAEAVRQVGLEDKVPVVDLNSMSLKIYEALGESGTKKFFVFYPANTYPGQSEELKDNTHFNNFGAYELARCIVEGIRANVPALTPMISDDAGIFDPSKPDAADKFDIPASPFQVIEKPAGS